MNDAELKLFDDVISGQLDVFRLAASKRKEVFKRLAAIEKELIDKLATGDFGRGERARFTKFLAEADEIIKSGYDGIQAQLEWQDVAETVAKITAQSLTTVLGPLDLTINIPRQDYFDAIARDTAIQGTPQAEWWARQSDNLRMSFAAQMRQGLASNETNQKLIQRVIGKNGVGGIMTVARHQAAALVQTGTSAVANDARLATFKSNSDIVIGVRQVSTLDSHTSTICIAYSGNCWDLDGKPIRGTKLPFNGGPPRHFNCRSVLVPILKTFKQLGLDVGEVKATTRASDEGQIAANTTFDAFLKRKSQDYQDALLGEGRADLWRAGKITLRDLVSGDGRPLTLKELRQKAGLD